MGEVKPIEVAVRFTVDSSEVDEAVRRHARAIREWLEATPTPADMGPRTSPDPTGGVVGRSTKYSPVSKDGRIVGTFTLPNRVGSAIKYAMDNELREIIAAAQCELGTRAEDDGA